MPTSTNETTEMIVTVSHVKLTHIYDESRVFDAVVAFPTETDRNWKQMEIFSMQGNVSIFIKVVLSEWG